MELKEELKNALETLRKEKKRKFEQTVDLIVNLQKFDLKKTQLNLFVTLPHKVKDKKICGFLETVDKRIDTIQPDKFPSYAKDKSKLKGLVNKYDFFIAQASVMPKVALTFGRVLGPVGKMPSPQLGLLMNVNDQAVEDLVTKINNSVKIRAKEASIKIPVGKENMTDSEIIENVTVIYNTLLKNFPREKENVKNIEMKFTMTKPVKIGVR